MPFSATAVPDSDGKFSVDIRIPSVLFPIGDYYVTANYGGLSSSQNFSIISESNFGSEKTDDESNNDVIHKKPSSSEKLDAGGYAIFNVKTIFSVSLHQDSCYSTPVSFRKSQIFCIF